jgi:hypothetical protein
MGAAHIEASLCQVDVFGRASENRWLCVAERGTSDSASYGSQSVSSLLCGD